MAQNQGFEQGKVRVSREADALGFSYQGEKFWAVKPEYTGTYTDVGSAIERDGLLKPSFGMTVAYAHPAFLPLMNRGVQDTEDALQIRWVIKNNHWLWGFTIIDYRKDKGAFFYEDEDESAIFGSFRTNQLEEMLGRREENKAIFSNDGKLRFAPFETYKNEWLELDALAKSSYLTALANGAEQAALTAEIAATFAYGPRLLALDSGEVINQETIVSSLGSDRFFGSRLVVGGDDHGVYWSGNAFGVSRTGEAVKQ
ncbi:MAG TPA: hypothetical protein VJJ21_04315 [Candidatus Nanoarchaeia archaeon]|nr:hypothetical protein [Candidatus Nanoarchaeia archaeon]